MSEQLFGGMIPIFWKAPEWCHAFEQLIIVNWLDVEIGWTGPRTVEQENILAELAGWRNREVHCSVHDNRERWGAETCKQIYGENIPLQNIHWSKEHGYSHRR